MSSVTQMEVFYQCLGGVDCGYCTDSLSCGFVEFIVHDCLKHQVPRCSVSCHDKIHENWDNLCVVNVIDDAGEDAQEFRCKVSCGGFRPPWDRYVH